MQEYHFIYPIVLREVCFCGHTSFTILSWGYNGKLKQI